MKQLKTISKSKQDTSKEPYKIFTIEHTNKGKCMRIFYSILRIERKITRLSLFYYFKFDDRRRRFQQKSLKNRNHQK